MVPKFVTGLKLSLCILGLWSGQALAQSMTFPAKDESALVTFFGSVEQNKADELAKDFRQNALTCFTRLQELGVTEIQGQDLVGIKERVAKTDVLFFREVWLQSDDQMGTYRGTAYWSRDLNAIFVSQKHWERIKNKVAISCHEYSGLFGLSDDRFQLTSVMNVLDLVETVAERKTGVHSLKCVRFLKDRLRDGQLLALGGGGITGVDGGGDFRPLGYKSNLMVEALFAYEDDLVSESNLMKLLKFYQNLSIEFSVSIRPGAFSYSSQERKLFIPNDPFTQENRAANTTAASELNKLFIQWIADGKALPE